MRNAFCLLLLGAVVLSGCAGRTEFGGAPNLQVYESAELPAPSPSDLVSVERQYLIGPFDKLAVTVFNVPELSLEEVQADSGGNIAVPLIGTVQAGGRSTHEVAREIEDRLRGRYVRDPQVAVNLTEAVGQFITVGGQVKEPGTFPVVGEMTLLTAVAKAKGLTEFARLEDVVVFRMVNGQRMAALYNLQAIERGAYPDPEVYPKDVVMVGDSPARRLFKDALQLAPALVTPLIYIIR